AKSVTVRDQILADYPELAASSLWGISGNGSWIQAEFTSDENEDGLAIVNRALAFIASKYAIPGVIKIDPTVKDANPVGVVPGTFKCKAEADTEWPQRMATLDSPDRAMKPIDLKAWLDKIGAPKVVEEGGKPKQSTIGRSGAWPDTGIDCWDAFDRKNSW